MSDIQLYLSEVEKDKVEAHRIVEACARKVEKKELKLVDLISSLQEYINNKDDGNQRARSVGFLADLLAALPPKVLSGQERRLLCDFILGRLESDVEGVGASARGLIALESLGKWTAETAQQALQAFLNNTHPLRQFKLQGDRYAIVQLFDLIIANYRTAARDLHETDPVFLPHFIAYFEGEKDPRNLMIIFSLLRVPMTEWDISAHAQDLFESVFNYFPITFKPPPDDPYGITAQDLKDRLRACISSNSDFAPYAFPHLLDKLDSTSMNTKRDVIRAIQSCIITYEAATINLYSITLWDALKFEILNVQEEDLAEAALEALALMAAKFTPGEDGPLVAYLRPIVKECNEHLEDAPTKQSQAAGRILHAVAGASPKVAERILKGVIPTLFALYKGSESMTKRRGLLEVFNEIVKAFVILQADQPSLNVAPLTEYATEALGLMIHVLTNAPKSEVSFRLASLDGLTQLVKVNKVLPETDLHQVIDTVTEIILHEHLNGHGDIRAAAIKALIDMTHASPDSVRDRSIPAFMVELPERTEDVSSVTPVLEAFAELSSERQIFDTITLRLKNRFLSVHNSKTSLEYQRAILLALLYAFKMGSPAQDNGCLRAEYYTEYAQPLVESVKGLANEKGLEGIIDTIGRICNEIIRPQGVHFQNTVHNTNMEWLSTLAKSGPANIASAFLLQYFAAIRSDVVDDADAIELLRAQVENITTGCSTQERGQRLRLVSLVLNKFVDPKAVNSVLATIPNGDDLISLKGSSSENTIALSFAVAKALLVSSRNSALSNTHLTSCLGLLSSPKGTVIARHFVTLLAPDDILTKDNHCVISRLYKQKLFNQATPLLCQTIKSTTDPVTKSNILIALSGILRWLPYSILQPSLETLILPLMQSLDLTSDDPHSDGRDPEHHAAEYRDVKVASLTVFEAVLMHDPSLLAVHVSSLVTRLLNLTGAPSHSPAIRAKALQCLTLVPRQLKTEAVVPYRRQVVRRLISCLDDAKRSVRTEAVRCRKAWLALDEGGDDDE